jgi:Fe2+ or Zn2+ uptake regulation protein
MSTHFASAGFHRENPLPDRIPLILHNVGLHVTAQRISLASLLLSAPGRRFTAEMLYDEAQCTRCPASRATVCNTLRRFENAGLLRRSPVQGSKKAWFAADRRRFWFN